MWTNYIEFISLKPRGYLLEHYPNQHKESLKYMGSEEREIELDRWDWKPKWLTIKSRVARWSSE